MKKSQSISLLFILIFLLGILGTIGYVNRSLNKKSEIDLHISPVQQINRAAFQV
ncbi:hypothetical protein ACW6QP_01005 [Salegentibacter sp. HM20]